MKKMQRKFHDIVQEGDVWHNLRKGKATSSNFDKIYANYGKAFGNPAIQYAQKKALERVTGVVDLDSGFKSSHMERGNELEPIAAGLYQDFTFNTVRQGGFMEYGYLGDSNDGNVGEKGCIEIKCVIANTHWKRITGNDFDKSYKGQIQGHMMIGQKEWCDFVSYCPEFPKDKQLFIKRVYPDLEYQKQLMERLLQFEEKVQEFVKLISDAA